MPPNTPPNNTVPTVNHDIFSSGSPSSSGIGKIPGVGGGGGGSSPLMLIIIVLLALGTIGFGAGTYLYYQKAAKATNTLEAAKAAAAEKAREDQKAEDEAAFTKLNQSPFRAYTAPVAFGGFTINFPKNWSSTVNEQPSGTQVDLHINPDFVRKSGGNLVPFAVRIHFEDRTKNNYTAQFSGNLKNKRIKQADINVSGQPGLDFTGTFSDGKTVREVVIPVRDKVLVFTTQNAAYASEFNQILAQAKIIP